MSEHNLFDQARALWDAAAPTFDIQPDHGLRDPIVRAAWLALLQELLPGGQENVLDIGCGTGSLSLLLAELNQHITGLDFSPAMIDVAKEKAKSTGRVITFHMMDAALPKLPEQTFDSIVCRHLLWALPDPARVLGRWERLLKPDGCLLLIEGFWHTGSGLHSGDIIDMLPPSLSDISYRDLSKQANLWGGEMSDERYAILAARQVKAASR